MGFAAVAPEISVLAIAAVVLLLDLFPSRERRGRGASGLFTIAAVCLGLTLLNTLSLRGTATLTDAFVLDPFALLAKRVLLAVALLSIIGLAPYVRARRIEHRAGESIVLILFTTVGGMVLVSAREWLTLFVAFELLSLPLYVMTCLEKDRPNAVEGAIKLFLFGSVSSAILLLGIALLFADRGGTFFADGNGRAAGPLGHLASALILTGFGFKIAAFPFSLWVPDTYESAPTPVVAFLSVAPKAAAVAALFRVSIEAFAPAGIHVGVSIATLAALAMIVGNLLALRQSNLTRLLAFSGIAQIGYVLLALAAGSREAAGLALFFFVAYLFSNAGAFLTVAAMECCGEEPTRYGARDMIGRSPFLAATFLVFLLSLGGIPFALGFWGKMYVFVAAARAGMWGLILLGATLAVVALYYYLDVARAMLIVREPGPPLTPPAALAAVILACALVVGGGGLVPGVFLRPCLRAADSLLSPRAAPVAAVPKITDLASK